MKYLSINRKVEGLAPASRPWLLGIPAFLIALMLLLWLIGRLASWIFVVLKVNK
jgi:hypothetical protein